MLEESDSDSDFSPPVKRKSSQDTRRKRGKASVWLTFRDTLFPSIVPPRTRKEEIIAEEDEYDPIRTFTDPDPAWSTLCTYCKSFMDDLHVHPWTDAKRVKQSVSRFYSWRDLDWGAQYATCVLCRIVWDIVSSTYRSAPGYAETNWIDTGWTYTLRPTKLGELHDAEPTQSLGHAASLTKDRCVRWCLGIEIDDHSRSKKRLLITNAIHGATRPLPKPFYTGQEPSPFAQRPFLYGRPRALECDINLLSSWLGLCKSHHKIQCGRKPSRYGTAIRLIDTKDQRILTYRPGGTQALDYVGLSYVCGDKGQSYVQKGITYSHFATNGSLKDLRLPHTISDAVSLVQRLGLQYLWVGCLCINQDDSFDRAEQISNMGFVYQHATFTIIAASGTDCEAGLPGLRPGTRFNEQRITNCGSWWYYVIDLYPDSQ